MEFSFGGNGMLGVGSGEGGSPSSTISGSNFGISNGQNIGIDKKRAARLSIPKLDAGSLSSIN